MAQHYVIKDYRVRKSIGRIVPKVWKDIQHKMLMDWAYYNKSIRHLDEDVNPAGYAFEIGPYNMRKILKDEPYAEENAMLEVHLDREGKLMNVFYAL